MSVVPQDEALTQFISKDEFLDMSSTFSALAESGKNVTRLPRKEFDRRQIVAAFQEAFDLIGGVPRLAIWAHHNPTEFYKLYGKLIPTSSHMELAGQVQHIIRPALPPSPLDGEYYVNSVKSERAALAESHGAEEAHKSEAPHDG